VSAVCAICGATDPFDLGLCPGCGGGPVSAGDTLVFVQASGTAADTRRVAGALEHLLHGRAHVSETHLVAGGHRALLRVPETVAGSAVAHLARHGIPAEARPAGRALAPVPRGFGILLACIVLVGLVAGARAEPMLTWTSPLCAVLLAFAAQTRLRRPAIRTDRRAAFPAPVERAMAEAFGRLPMGTARDLLVRLVGAAEPFYRALEHPSLRPRRRDVHGLVAVACRAAENLADLERGILALGDDPKADPPRTLRDRLVAKFRDGISALHRLRAEAVDDDPAAAELARLVTALDEDAEAYAAARRELAALGL
jgi:hypothetical protein